jgi:hypothetical protein
MSGVTICNLEDIVAYLDGELIGSALTRFEAHVESCQFCRSELTLQRQFFCELDAAISDEADAPAPVGFSRIITAHAQMDMRGVRSKTEHYRAVRLMIVLALAAFAFLGATAITVISSGARVITLTVSSLIRFFASALYDAGASGVVISRVISRKYLLESGSLVWLIMVLVLFLLVLSGLMLSYHRTRNTRPS